MSELSSLFADEVVTNAYTKILRVARTIADLELEERVRAPHIAEAIQGRLFDRETAV